MKWYGYVVMVGLLAAGPVAGQRVWQKPARTVFEEPISEVALTRVGGYPFLDVRVNGRSYRFALETGASFIGVSERAARALGLVVQATGGPGGNTPERTTVIDSLQIGGVKFYGVTAAVSDRWSTRDFDGVVSPPLLRDVLYTLDLRHNRLRLERGALPPIDQRSVQPIARQDRAGRIDMVLELGDAKVAAVIDTQSLHEVVLPDSLEDVLSLGEPAVSVGQASGPTQGTFTLRGARLRDVARLGETVLTELPVVFRNRPGAVIGLSFLEHFVVTIDDANGRVRVIPHATPVSFGTAAWQQQVGAPQGVMVSGPTGRYLLGLRASGTPLQVISVEPGSNIDQAGIRVGDVVLEVDGQPTERLRQEDWQRILEPGVPVRLTLSRGGQRFQTSVTPIPRPGVPEREPQAAAQPTPIRPGQEAELRLEIERLNRSMIEAFRRNDPLAIAAHYSDDARIIGPGGNTIEGRAAVNRYWSSFPTQGRTWTLEVLAAGGTRELAYQYGRSTIAGGQRSQVVDFIAIWKRQVNGDLKLAIDFWTPST